MHGPLQGGAYGRRKMEQWKISQSRRSCVVGEGTARPVREAAKVLRIRCNAPFSPPHHPDVSLRGAKRRGNLAGPGWITWHFRRKRNCLHEIATGAKRPRNDKFGGIAPLNLCRRICRCARRSLSAATDAIGLCVMIDALYELEVPPRDCHGREAPSQ